MNLQDIAAQRIKSIRENNALGDDVPVGLIGVDPQMTIQKDGRTVSLIANTIDVDDDNEVVVPSGADGWRFFKLGTFYVDHIKTTDYAVGHLRRRFPFPNNAKFDAWMLHAYVYKTALGDDILEMVREGGVGVSIGFFPVEAGKPTENEMTKYGPKCKWVIRSWKWLETSFTALPCNSSCVTTGIVKGNAEAKMAVIDRLLTKGTIRRESAAAVGFPVKVRRKIVCRV